MKTVDTAYMYTTEVNRSKFISHLVPIAKYGGLQEKLKHEHPKANHVVYAIRYLNEHDQIVENSTDDNEPKGCAGVPSLNVLRGYEMINCAVLTVRYFGGIKLGTGGMARAYASSVKNVLEVAALLEYVKQLPFSFETAYNDVDKTLYIFKQLDLAEYSREFGIDKVQWHVNGSEEQIRKLKEMKGL